MDRPGLKSHQKQVSKAKKGDLDTEASKKNVLKLFSNKQKCYGNACTSCADWEMVMENSLE